MARVISSGLGHISGRIGDHIFYAVGDKRYVRRAPAKVSNPRSPAQCLQRWRQVCVQTLFRSVKGTLFQRAADEAAVRLGKRSGYHLFLSRNINAFGEGDRVDYAKLSFGGACLQLPDGFTCVQNEAGHWELAWQAGIPMATAAPDDRLIVAAICPDEPYRLIVLENICALRKDGRAEGEWAGKREGIAFILSVLLCIRRNFFAGLLFQIEPVNTMKLWQFLNRVYSAG